ncbi:MAG: FAD-dependent oxidoreductase [Myxococcota bacterium]
MTVSFWLQGAAPIYPRLAAAHRCEVAIVGAGLCGVSAALTLATAGVDVAVFEADQVAGRATGRNAGFILQGTAERYNRACALMGHDRARAVHQWSILNHEHIAQTIAEARIDCGYRRRGSLQLAGSPEEEAELLESARMLSEDGFAAEVVEGDALGQIYLDAGFKMGVILPEDGEIHPADFVRGAAAAATRRGAQFFEQTTITTIEDASAGDVRLRTQSGHPVQCQLALVCTNARTSILLPWFQDKIDPVRGQMLATAPVPRIFERPIYADHGYDYWRQDDAGRIILGGWRNLDPEQEIGLDDRLHPEIQERMTHFLSRFSALQDVEITHRWAGIMGFSRDGLPAVGPAPGAAGVLVGAGFTGHGFGFAWLAGHALAMVVLEGRHAFADQFAPRRWSG